MNRTLNVDYYDLVLRGGEPGTPEFYDERRIEGLLRRCREEGIQRVLWRLSVCGKEAYYSKVRTPFDWAEPRELERQDDRGDAALRSVGRGLRAGPALRAAAVPLDYLDGRLLQRQPGIRLRRRKSGIPVHQPRRHTPLPRDALLQLSRGARPPGGPTSRDRRRLPHRRVLPVPAQPRRRMRAVLPARLLRL